MKSLRIGGLSSGLDTDQIIKDLMKVRRIKVDSIKQKRQQADWQRTDYRAINNSLRTLRDSSFNMKLQGTFQVKKATSGNESVAKATALSTASAGVNSIKISELASAAYVTSTAALGSVAGATTLKDQFGLASAEDITLSINGKPVTVNTGTESIQNLATKINALTKDDGSSLGVVASYDSTMDRFFLSTTATGLTASITLSQTSPDPLTGTNLLDKLKLDTYTYPVTGKNARFDLNGTVNLEQPTNEFTISGVKYTLIETSASTISVQVTRDTDSIYNSVKAFVDLYNTSIDTMNKELGEERYRDYLPLTDEQRETLSDEQEKAWEEKAKSGMLKSDSYLSGIVGKLRTNASSVVSGIASVTVDGSAVTHNSLSAIGIVTGSYFEEGKLNLKNNGADLKKAIESDPDGVMNLFTQSSEDAQKKGLAIRLYENLNNSIDGIIQKAGNESLYNIYDDSFLGKKIGNYDKQIDSLNVSLNTLEDRYYRQFTAMEKAISRLNSQSAWLSQQFSSGQN